MQRNADRARSGQQAVGIIAVVIGFKEYDLITRIQERKHRGKQRFGSACGDGDFLLRINTEIIICFLIPRDGAAQTLDTRHGSVLIFR